MKLLLDTDIGSDIDDAVCLAYLLAQADAGRCELLGITTVTGDPVGRAKLASALCQASGQDIPIVAGAADPLLVDQRQDHVRQLAGLRRWKHRSEFPGDAVVFLRDVIRSHPGEITLLTIGPLTNVALLFASYPDVALQLGGLVMMAGSFTSAVAPTAMKGPGEWNVLLDPHAAAIVYRAALAEGAPHRSIGLDVTLKVKMTATEVAERFRVDRLRPVLDFAEEWFRTRTTLTFHDPLAAATLFDASLVGFEGGRVAVELLDEAALGRTRFLAEPNGRHEVATTVDAARFLEHYFAVVAR